ncbi:tetratricopeptide repeat protein [Streptomyces europaeiscabiei]|uniref:tetratricopeptide repeat protein n=1 Tax=Streptomyces europaeiscabiei TaxID=146819 RepID=UPI002E18D62B
MIDELEVEAGPLARWQVHWCDPRREVSWYAADPVLAGLPTLAEWAHAGTQLGQPVLLRADGWSVPEVNGFFASARMRNASTGTRRKYAFAVAVWLGFLDAAGRAWHDANAEDVAGFKFWRMTDEANVRRVAGGTVLDDLIAISAFYRWAGSRFGVSDPVARRQVPGPDPGTSTESFEASPHLVRSKDVKWLDPAGYARWVDVGLRGLDLRGREIDGWRGRNSQRDCAFVDGLYGTGLRLSEWASVLRLELPADDETRTYYTCQLAEACAKGGRGRRFWMPRSVLVDDVLTALRECADRGNEAAAMRLADLLVEQGRADEALVTLRDSAGRGYWAAAGRLVEQGHVEEALTILRAGVDARLAQGAPPVSVRKAIRTRQQITRLGDGRGQPTWWLADILVEQGRVQEALTTLRDYADRDAWAAERLADLLVEQGRIEEALTALRFHADRGDQKAMIRLVTLLAERGRIEEALSFLHPHAKRGEEKAIVALADLLIEQGDIEEALTVLRAHTGRGKLFLEEVAIHLARVLAWQGRTPELRVRADNGDWHAAEELAGLLIEQGDNVGALTVLRAHAYQSPQSALLLAELLIEQGDVPQALALLRAHADYGDSDAVWRLTELLAQQRPPASG